MERAHDRGAIAQREPQVHLGEVQKVTLDDLKAGAQGGIVKSIRKLTKSAANPWDKTAFAQFTPSDITFQPAGPLDVLPETEHGVRGYLNSV